MKVALVLHDFPSILSNGCVQNSFFLLQGMKALGYAAEFVYEDFHNEGVSKVFSRGELGDDIIMRPVSAQRPETISDFDLLVATTMNMSVDLASLAKSKHIATVQTKCGADYMIDQLEFVASGTLKGYAGFSDVALHYVDELWVQNGMRDRADYFEALSKRPTAVIPNFWNMRIIDALLKGSALPLWSNEHHKGTAADILIMESNLLTGKNAVIPIVACERLLSKKPELLNLVYVFCFPESEGAMAMTNRLELNKRTMLRRFSRQANVDIFRTFCKGERPAVFLSNQLQCPLNYAHFEALWLGFPLVHNSDHLKELGLGYYYRQDSLDEAGAQIERAILEYPAVAAETRERSRRIIQAAFDPEHPLALESLKTAAESLVKRTKQGTGHELARKLECMVLCNAAPRGRERRRKFQQQLTFPDFELPCTVTFMDGFTPDMPEAKKFFDEGKHCQYGESKAAMALLRGVQECIKRFLDGSKEYLLIMEDDVVLCKNVGERLLAAIRAGPHLDVLRVGYMPGLASDLRGSSDCWPHSPKGEIRTGCMEDVLRPDAMRNPVGAQATLYTRKAAQEFYQRIGFPCLREVVQSVQSIPRPAEFMRAWPLAYDHILRLPTLGKSAFVYPPLAIEGDLKGSTIGSHPAASRWGYAALHRKLDLSMYYGTPNWLEAYQSAQ